MSGVDVQADFDAEHGYRLVKGNTLGPAQDDSGLQEMGSQVILLRM